MAKKLEIYNNSIWLEVSQYIFRSWAGERRVNGIEYKGKVFYLGSRKLYKQSEVK